MVNKDNLICHDFFNLIINVQKEENSSKNRILYNNKN